jgi:hypothetical protein
MNNTIIWYTTQIKQKLSPNSPVIVIAIDPNHAWNIIEYNNKTSR